MTSPYWHTIYHNFTCTQDISIPLDGKFGKPLLHMGSVCLTYFLLPNTHQITSSQYYVFQTCMPQQRSNNTLYSAHHEKHSHFPTSLLVIINYTNLWKPAWLWFGSRKHFSQQGGTSIFQIYFLHPYDMRICSTLTDKGMAHNTCLLSRLVFSTSNFISCQYMPL